jgi:hypothetical protein
MDVITHCHMCLVINNNGVRGFKYFNLKPLLSLDISTTEDLYGFKKILSMQS